MTLGTRLLNEKRLTHLGEKKKKKTFLMKKKIWQLPYDMYDSVKSSIHKEKIITKKMIICDRFAVYADKA